MGVDAGIELRRGPLRLALRPDLGGCIAGLWLDELPVLRSSEPSALAGARQSGCYPLLPYSNRLGYRRFRWQGREYTTQPNFDASAHSVHGVGWQRPWSVESLRADDAVLALQHAGDADWPFPFAARQVLSLSDEGLNLGLSITNTGAAPAPFGLGWHPYFPKRQRSRLHIELTDRWDPDDAGLPTRRVAQSGIDGDVAHLDYDHCFEGFGGSARVRDERLVLRLSASLSYLVVYTPPLKDYFCVEPVSHVSNAIHMAEPAKAGLRSLMPGEHMDAWFKIAIGRP